MLEKSLDDDDNLSKYALRGIRHNLQPHHRRYTY